MADRQRQPEPDPPAIPVRLSQRPVIGGLAVPWVVAHHADGTPVLGFIDGSRQAACLARGWCQACGQPLGSPLILMVRSRDVVAGSAVEPALHPECAAYSAYACPMLAGMMARYRATPRPARQERCGDASCACRAWVRPGDRDLRAGRPREPFAAVWISQSEYRVTDGPAAVAPGLALRGVRVLKVRPVPPGPAEAWSLLAASIPRDSVWPPEVLLAAALDLASQAGRADNGHARRGAPAARLLPAGHLATDALFPEPGGSTYGIRGRQLKRRHRVGHPPRRDRGWLEGLFSSSPGHVEPGANPAREPAPGCAAIRRPGPGWPGPCPRKRLCRYLGFGPGDLRVPGALAAGPSRA